MGKVLTQAQIDQFWNEGYVFPFDCLSAEEAAERAEHLAAYEREVGGNIQDRLRVKVHLAFMWLFELAHHPRILDAVEDLVGPDILLYLSTFWFKNAHDPRFVSWHQDSAYYGLDPHDVITLWFAFTDSTPENGCMRVIPGSHKLPDFVHDETYDPDNLLARGQTIADIDESTAVDMALRAGQFSMHHERLVHGSAANNSGRPRLGMSFTYLPTRVRCNLPGRTALLVRGVDEYGYWEADPKPRFDLDPVCLDHIAYWIKGYADPNVVQEARRAG